MSQDRSISFTSRRAKDKTAYILVCLFSFLAMVPLFFILWDVVLKGYKNFNLRLFTEVTPSSVDALMARMNGDPIPGGIGAPFIRAISASTDEALLSFFPFRWDSLSVFTFRITEERNLPVQSVILPICYRGCPPL